MSNLLQYYGSFLNSFCEQIKNYPNCKHEVNILLGGITGNSCLEIMLRAVKFQEAATHILCWLSKKINLETITVERYYPPDELVFYAKVNYDTKGARKKISRKY